MEKEALLKQLGFSDEFLRHLKSYEDRVQEAPVIDTDNVQASESFESTQIEGSAFKTLDDDLVVRT